MPVFFGIVALFVALGIMGAWLPTVPCAVCGGSGSIRSRRDNYVETFHPYGKTLLGDQFKVDPCGECHGKGRVTWVRAQLSGGVEQRPAANR